MLQFIAQSSCVNAEKSGNGVAYISFFFRHSPHLNCAETLWRKLKKEWLRPEDYADKESLFYAVHRSLAAVGNHLTINFSPFNAN